MHHVERGPTGAAGVSREVENANGQNPRHSVTIDEQEVFGLIHRPVELAEPQPSGFVGRVASWAESAERRYGDWINPVMTYVENGPHRRLVDLSRGRGLALG